MISSSISPCLSSAVSFCSSLPAGSRVGVVGSREFTALELGKEFIAALPKGLVVVSGAAEGVDQCAAAYARSRGMVVDELPFVRGIGKAGGPVRNHQLVSSCSVVVGFSCGSSGTENALSIARQLHITHFRISPPPAPGVPVQASLF